MKGMWSAAGRDYPTRKEMMRGMIGCECVYGPDGTPYVLRGGKWRVDSSCLERRKQNGTNLSCPITVRGAAEHFAMLRSSLGE